MLDDDVDISGDYPYEFVLDTLYSATVCMPKAKWTGGRVVTAPINVTLILGCFSSFLLAEISYFSTFSFSSNFKSFSDRSEKCGWKG